MWKFLECFDGNKSRLHECPFSKVSLTQIDASGKKIEEESYKMLEAFIGAADMVTDKLDTQRMYSVLLPIQHFEGGCWEDFSDNGWEYFDEDGLGF